MIVKENLPKVGKGNERKGVIKRETETGIEICREAETGIEIGKRRGREIETRVVIGITEIGIEITVREGSEAGIEMIMMIISEDGTMRGEIYIYIYSMWLLCSFRRLGNFNQCFKTG